MLKILPTRLYVCTVFLTTLTCAGVSHALDDAISRQALTAINEHSYKRAVELVYEDLVRGNSGAKALVQMIQFKCAELPKIGRAYRRYCLPAFSLAAQAKEEREARMQAQIELEASKARAEAAAAAEKSAQEEATRQAYLADPLRNAFLALSKSARKQVQSRLKERGYYRSGVDGLYGRGTRSGLDAYARATKAKDHDQRSGASALLSNILALPSPQVASPRARFGSGGRRD